MAISRKRLRNPMTNELHDYDELLRQVDTYYTGKLNAFGATPRGVDWNSTDSQELRFEQLSKIVTRSGHFSINDYGCGYGAAAAYLTHRSLNFSYFGYDISSAMISQASEQYANDAHCTFSSRLEKVPKAEYTIASGIFNVRFENTDAIWQDYIFTTLHRIAAVSTTGFAFNMLTTYSDADRMRPDLYYADPHVIFDYCRTHFSRHVALLHDYPLYEFTCLVRLN